MSKIHEYICDCCGERKRSDVYWASKPSTVKLKCPPDGTNGGEFSFEDCCSICRVSIHDAIATAVKTRRSSEWEETQEWCDSPIAERMAQIREIIESVDNRCLAVDGPVANSLQEMTIDELRRIYALAGGEPDDD